MTGAAPPRRFTRPYPSHAAFYADAYARAVTATRRAGRVGADLLMADQDAGDWSDAPSPDLVVLTPLVAPGRTVVDLGAGRFERPRLGPRDLVVTPPHTATTVIVDAPHSIRALAVNYGRLLALAGEGSGLPGDGDFGALHAGVATDEACAGLVERLWLGADPRAPRPALWADALVLQLAAEMLRLRDGRHEGASFPRAEDRRVRRAVEVLEARLGEDVGLAELAAAVGLSPSHLGAAFRAATGLPPHRWLVRRRIERACELLANTDQGVTEIALACGFGSSQHFATTFRQHMGATPSAYRDAQNS